MTDLLTTYLPILVTLVVALLTKNGASDAVKARVFLGVIVVATGVTLWADSDPVTATLIGEKLLYIGTVAYAIFKIAKAAGFNPNDLIVPSKGIGTVIEVNEVV